MNALTSERRDPGESVWPAVRTGGELAPAEREWLHANGAGAYAMSTLALMHTRRHHGMLVAALEPPLRRHVILSHAETVVTTREKTYRLSTHQFPSLAPTPGYRSLEEFAQDPLPRWTYRLGRVTFTRTLSLVRGRNALVIAYRWDGLESARLSLRPLMPLRPADSLIREHGGMIQRVTLRPAEVEIQPVPELPPIVFGHPGVFMGSPDWWRRLEYLSDRDDGREFQEDLWSPGVFEIELRPHEARYVVVSLGELPGRPPEALMNEMRDHLSALDPGPNHAPTTRRHAVFADAFCAEACSHATVVAGYPSLDVRMRDQLVAFSGLYLARGRIAAGKRALQTVIKSLRGGFLPAGLGERVAASPCLDATLWLFDVARELLEATGPNDAFLKDDLYPVLRRVFVRIGSSRGKVAWLNSEGLVVNRHLDVPLTWMDARNSRGMVSPRQGLAVELQALWARGTETLARLARERGDASLERAALSASERTRAAFRARFWCSETDYPFDCLSEESDTAHAWADAAVRPNALIALALDPSLFERWQAAAIVERVQSELLAPGGIRSLSPKEPGYVGHYAGSAEERQSAYHQGSAWPFLLGFYVRARLVLESDDEELRASLRTLVESLSTAGPVLGFVPQLADGDEPYRLGGAAAHALSTAQLLKALVFDLKL